MTTWFGSLGEPTAITQAIVYMSAMLVGYLGVSTREELAEVWETVRRWRDKKR